MDRHRLTDTEMDRLRPILRYREMDRYTRIHRQMDKYTQL
jgi:hypothetical protein